MRQRASQRDLALIFAFVIAGVPITNRHGPILHLVSGLMTVLQRCKIDEGFEGGAGLALRIHRTIELTLVIGIAAHQRLECPIVSH